MIREGNAISVEELKKQKELLVALKDKDAKLKNQLRNMSDIAPFAISGRLFANLMGQVAAEKEAKMSATSCAAINSALQSTHTQIADAVATLKFSTSQKQAIEHIIAEVFAKNILDISNATIDDIKILVDYTDNEANEFQALFDNIRYSFSTIFKQLVKDIKITHCSLPRHSVRLWRLNMMTVIQISKR